MSRRDRFRVIVVALMMLAPSPVSAQEPGPGSFVRDIVKAVMVDPTTYVPAIVAYQPTRLDWRSSQIFFRNGWMEGNPRFTVSGRPNDVAISYAAGNRQILADSISDLQLSLINNASTGVVESLLLQRYPSHRSLVRTVGWIERVAMASYWSYRLSAGHLQQWQQNVRLGQQLGLD